MTVSGQRISAENVAAPEATQAQGLAAVPTAGTPLPPGWQSFCSRPYQNHMAHWYATPPWNPERLRDQYGNAAAGLAQTVVADTWPRLHIEVAAQEDLRALLAEERGWA